MKNATLILFFAATLFLFTRCKSPKDNSHINTAPPDLTSTTPVKGYNLLSKICGIWDGGVTSTTPLGGYPEWIVDFRPISAAQVSAKNELDTLNDIFMSFFITYSKGEYKMAFRNGGSFAGMKRVSYMEIDSVVENSNQSYYRFVDFVQGDKRTVTEVIFKTDSLIIRSFTNHGTAGAPITPHMEWRAKLQDASSCQPAISYFSFPQKQLVKDLSTTFALSAESIFYNTTSDPYGESQQPYLGKANINYTSTVTIDPSKYVILMITTKPMISGYAINYANLATRSRYVILSGNNHSFTFNYMHPGTYYLYALYDADGNRNFNSGDGVSTTNTTFTVPETGEVSATAQINFTIP